MTIANCFFSDIPAALLNSTLDALKFTTPCTECQQAITRRVQEVVVKWSLTPVSTHSLCADFLMYEL